MKINWLLKRIIPLHFRNSIKRSLGVPSVYKSLLNLKKLGFQPRYIVDCGAYEGLWTKEFFSVFPNAHSLLVEAQSNKIEVIQNNLPKNITVYNALIGSEDDKEVLFSISETSSSVIDSLDNSSIISYSKTRKLDTIINELQFPEPDFIKIDVQGYEVEVLKGATKAIQSCEFVLLELTLMPLNNEPTILEVMNYMNNINYQLYDISSFILKPFDKALYQIDGLFVKKNSKYVNKNW